MECGKAPSGVRKVKKKQVKDEMDRIKQAEKKKRRLEKALAASAAIISELEKKNQKKKEEQQRLDEECAAIAEAVALHVLIGEESNKSGVPAMMHKEEEEWYPWGYGASNFGLFMGDSHARTTATVIPHSRQLLGSPNGDTCWVSDGCGGSGHQWNGYGLSDGGYFLSDVQAPYVMERDWEAAEAISSLQIADDGVNAFVFNRMMRG
ncbi:hypothetical protein HanRHA438_Chr14g0681921 [Helianthus annuus]|nr:hypothetical protein HanHA300_Chr14g0546921 [Helianthus annuus]KAJ0471244.1 hypothetical protein HanIR_Chr14g0727591 [Helianthus annuus]KAJ0658269.1 hypothetical protein HanLR1_Chr14g0555851 [Helianthus annuus]KAJ0816044.1 hypothetical protein HanPI659440_Chr00c21g0734841 [Helianthus annuus]KAJ0842564.1 hypothetical protein HanPSC8_Chr14g0643141 [Helianthus annuus]